MSVVGMPKVNVLNLKVETTPPRLTVIHGEQGITVDSTAPRRELNILGWYDRIAQEKTQQKDYYDKGIAKIVNEGNAMARLQDSGDPIPDFAATRLTEYYDDHQVVFGVVPRTPPDINIAYSPTSYQVERGTLTITYGDKYSGLNLTV